MEILDKYDEEDYEKIKNKIVSDYIDAIEKVIICGSRAKRTENMNSGIDLCISK